MPLSGAVVYVRTRKWIANDEPPTGVRRFCVHRRWKKPPRTCNSVRSITPDEYRYDPRLIICHVFYYARSGFNGIYRGKND